MLVTISEVSTVLSGVSLVKCLPIEANTYPFLLVFIASQLLVLSTEKRFKVFTVYTLKTPFIITILKARIESPVVKMIKTEEKK